MSLDLLDDRHGRRLFERTAGLSDVSEGESAVVDDIVSLCGGLPLAIRLAAHRFGRTASWSLADLRERLRGHDRALATLSVGNRSVTAAFHLSYQELDEAHRRTFRLLSLYPGPGFDAYAAVALADLEPEEASDRLDELCDAHLLQSPSPGRYRFHDLVREYAAAELSTAGDDTTAAVTRLLDGLRHTAYHVANLVYPNVKHYPYVPPVPAFAVPSLPDAETAADWYDTEIAALHGAVRLAVEYGLDVHAWQLAHPVDALNHYRGHVAAGLAMNQTALVAARRLDDPEVLAFALNNTATCHVMLSQFAAAVETFEEALELRRHGDARGRAAVHNNLGTALRRLGEFTAAASHFEAAVECARQAGTERLEAVAIANYAAVCDHLGQWSRALGLLERARGICERPGFERQLARVDHWCGVTYLNLGEPRRALEHLHRSRAFAEGVTESFGLCEVLNSIAVCLRTLGRHADALRHHRLAVDLSGELGDTAAHARNLTDFGRTLTDAGQAEAAIAALSEARALAIEVDSRYDAARAAHGLAEALIVTGATEDARRCLDAAADAYRAMGVPAAAGLREPRRRLENRR